MIFHFFPVQTTFLQDTKQMPIMKKRSGVTLPNIKKMSVRRVFILRETRDNFISSCLWQN